MGITTTVPAKIITNALIIIVLMLVTLGIEFNSRTFTEGEPTYLGLAF